MIATTVGSAIDRPIGSTTPGCRSGVRTLDGRSVAWFEVLPAEQGHPVPLGVGMSATFARVVDAARTSGMPLVVRLAGVTLEPDDDIAALVGWGRVARSLVAASGVVPTVVIVDGPVVTGSALLLGLFDVVVMCEGSIAYISGPEAVTSITGQPTDPEELGGESVHHTRSGVGHLRAVDPGHALALVSDVLAHLPPNNADIPLLMATYDPPDRFTPALRGIVPSDPRAGYDCRLVIGEIVDDGDLLELSAGFGRAIVCALARLDGHPVGIVATQPMHLAGAIDIESSQKAARFVQWCDAFGLPLVTIVDTPGYLPGRDLEWAGMIRHGGQLAFAYAAATVPRLCVITRKAYGGAFIVLDCKTMGNDVCLAWPAAEIAVMGAPGAVQILHRRELDSLPPGDRQSARATLEEDYALTHLNPTEAAARGYLDAVIDPAETRAVLCRSLPSLLAKRAERPERKHHNGPC